MKIGIAIIFSDGFSGGRLHAFLLGAELAAQGHDVTFICNRAPGFFEKLPPVPGKDKVRFVTLQFDLLRPPAPLAFDLWIVVHERSLNGRFFAPVLENARRQRTPLLLLTFETPNWQAAVLPGFEQGVLDALLRETAELGAQVLTSTNVGRSWAVQFFSHLSPDDIHVLSPPVLAGLYDEPVPRNPRLLLAFTRRSSAHKGFETVRRLLNARLRGWTIVLVDGHGFSLEIGEYARRKLQKDGVELVLHSAISEEEKIRLIKAARVLLFPSAFEGFGLPPGEARYWGTPVVCYDLPVLREIYGDSLRYVPANDPVAFEEVLQAELAQEPDFTPAPAARRIGDFQRWSGDVRRTLDAVMRRARSPKTLPSGRADARAHVVIVDQVGNWNKDDTAAAVGRATSECAIVTFEMPLVAQLSGSADAHFFIWSDTHPVVGRERDDLRGKLLQAVAAAATPWVFITEDTLVTPAETVEAACATLAACGPDVVGAAIPVRIHFQEDGDRHYRAVSGELLAACGVFRRDFLAQCLRATNVPGSRAQPACEASFLVLASGGRLVPAPGRSDRLPPRHLPNDFDLRPGGEGSWHAEFVRQRGGARPLDPLPCFRPDDETELARMIRLREAIFEMLCGFADRRLNRSALRTLVRDLRDYCPLWRAEFDLESPCRTYVQFSKGYLRYGRPFLTSRHMKAVVDAALAALTVDSSPPRSDPALERARIRLREIRDGFEIT